MTEKEPPLSRQLLAKPAVQVILFIFTIIYVVSPVDVIPDVMPILGWLDDLSVFVAQILSFVFYLKQKRKDFAAKKPNIHNEGNNNGR